MARFTLQNEITLKQLGSAVFELGALNIEFEASTESTIKNQLQEQINDVEKNIREKMLDLSERESLVGKTPNVVFHYDGDHEATGDYQLHIVVPDLDGKRIGTSEVIPANIDFTDFATECMGQIIIWGCGK